MAEEKSWFQTGQAGSDRSKQVDHDQAKRRAEGFGTQRFWLKKDTAAKILFLDSPVFFLHEHNLKIDGKFFNFYTCIKDMESCPLCDEGDSSSYAVAATCIDLTGKFTDKEGKEHGFQRKLFIAKGKARQHLLRQIERRDGDLKYCAYDMARGAGTTECGTGEDFEFIARMTKDQIRAICTKAEKTTREDMIKFLTPFDYAEELKPKSSAELAKVVNGSSHVGDEGGSGSGADPFSESGGLDDLLDGGTDAEVSIDDLL